MTVVKPLSIAPRKILVIALRFLGDVLLTTPLIRSLRRAYPDAQLDVLVYTNTAGMLEGNPDIDHIITQTVKPSKGEFWALIVRLYRKYDLAISTQVGDRPILYAVLASALRIAPVPPKPTKGWWKRFLVKFWVEFDDENTHTVLQHLKLLDGLAIPRQYTLVPPRTDAGPDVSHITGNRPYAVLHVYPQWIYKRWTVTGWVELGRYLTAFGLQVVFSGGPGADEIAYVNAIVKHLPGNPVNLAGQLSLAELTPIIAQARVFIGPDTGITHLAAATGVPVIALFGPTNPVKWAPWPYAYQQASNPFSKKGSQRVKNIYLLQGQTETACVPCHLEGCDRHQLSRSACLDMLSPERIKDVLADMPGAFN